VNLSLSTETREDGVTVVKVCGEITVYTAPVLRNGIADSGFVSAPPALVVLDLGECTFLDSTGLAVIIGALKKARYPGGQIAIACASGRVLQVFRITGMAKVLTMSDTVDEAAAALLAGAR
jgi:anti-sigma B factor antagonist